MEAVNSHDQRKVKANTSHSSLQNQPPEADQETLISNPNTTLYEDVVIVNNGTKSVRKVVSADERDYLSSFPAGYRFDPRDHELINYYLRRKVLNQPLPPNNIWEADLYRYNPDTLTEKYQGLGEKEWCFFTPRNRKYRNGTRPNRAAGSGYWKATGADRAIFHEGAQIGSKKALVFYEGKAPDGKKTNWIMHEYRVVGEPQKNKRGANDMRLDDWVLCRIYKKRDKFIKVHQREKKEATKALSDEASFLPNENVMEPYFLGGSSPYILPSFPDGVPPQFADNSDHFAKFNNNLMTPNQYYGSVQPVSFMPPIYSENSLLAFYPRDEDTPLFGNNLFPNVDSRWGRVIYCMYFMKNSNLDSNLDIVVQNNALLSSQRPPEN